MKKRMTFLLAVGLMLASAAAAQAVDVKISGQWDFTAQWANLSTNKYNPNKGQYSNFYQQLRTQVDIIASESVSGVLLFEIGDTIWGQSNEAAGGSAGGGIGADGVNIKVKSAFLDWIVPHTSMQVRMGLQEVVLPGLDESSQVFNDDVAGIVMNYAFTDKVGLTAWWLRPFSDNTDNYDTSNGRIRNRNFNEMDMFGLSVPLTFEGVDITPWGMYAAIGRDIFYGYEGATSDNHFRQILPRWIDVNAADFRASDGQSSAWWLGLTGTISIWDPFRFGWDFNYGHADLGHTEFNGQRVDLERAGWYAALMAEYAFENVTPGLVFWYASGDDDDWRDGSEAMPSVHASSPFTFFGQDGAPMDFWGTAFQSGLAGTWGLVFRLNDISFVEDLSHTLQVAYYRGTNDKAMTAHNGGPVIDPWANAPSDAGDAYTYMTTKDSAWEVNLYSEYDIYKNLKLGLALGYIKLDLSDSAWGSAVKNSEESAWQAGLGLQYTF